MKDIDTIVMERVIMAREAAGLNKTEFAARLGLSKQAYTPYESGTTPFSVNQLWQISRMFNRPLSWFFDMPTELEEDEEQTLSLYRQAKDHNQGKKALAILRTIAQRDDE